MNQSDKSRILWADSLKAILMVIVVIDHAIQYVEHDSCFYNHFWNITSSFYLPAFVAISGWFAYRKKSKAKSALYLIFRRCKQLLVPFLLWSFIKMVVEGDCTISRAWEMLRIPDSTFWFLWALFFIYIIFVLVQKTALLLRAKEDYFIILSAFMMMMMMVLLEFRQFGFQFIAYYYLYYVIGYFIHKYPIVLCNKRSLNISIFAMWLFLGWYWHMHEIPSWLSFIPYVPSTLLHYCYRGITALLMIYLLFNCYPIIGNDNTKFNRMLAAIGKITLGIYVVHILIIHCMSSYIDDLNAYTNTISLEFAVFIVLFPVSVGIVKILSCYNYTNRFLLGKN